jgi:hypothetical protein
MRSSAHPGRRCVTSAGRVGDEEELAVGVCEDAGVVVAVVGVVAAVDVAGADALPGLETSGEGGEPSATQPLSQTANAIEVIARRLRRPRKPVIMAPR